MRLTSGSATAKKTFIGQYTDSETSLSYLNARYYNPAQGQFLSEDSVFLGMGTNDKIQLVVLFDPQLQNGYAYARGNPIKLKDSNGNFLDIFLDVAFAIYDIGSLIVDEMRTGGQNRAVNLGALGADAASVFVPFATGAGVAVRAGAHVDSAVRAVDHMSQVRNIGRQGEAASGVIKNSERIPSMTSPGGYRIPDGLDHSRGVIQEVKNVGYQSFTRQLRDFSAYAESHGYSFELFVNESTRLSRPLQNAIEQGKVILKKITGE